MTNITNHAVIHPRAELGVNVEIGPYAVVGEHVKIGDGTKIGAHAILEGWTTIGRNCKIETGAVLGSEPQDLKYRGGESYVLIGDNTTIREYATVNRATFDGEATVVGSSCLIMSYCHIAHNCVLEDRVIMSSFAGLAGHILVEQNAIIGGLVGVHQFVQIGRNAIVGGGSAVRQDILPFTAAGGNPCKCASINAVGLRRHNYSQERITRLKRAFKIVFRSKLSEKDAIDTLRHEYSGEPDIEHIVSFMERSKRGLARM